MLDPWPLEGPDSTVPFGVVVNSLNSHLADLGSNLINTISFFIFLS